MSITNGNLFADEMKINLNMLGALVLHRVSGEIHITDIVTIYKSVAG